jgi:hypothetical protein
MNKKDFEKLVETAVIIRAIEKRILNEEMDKNNSQPDIPANGEQRLSGIKTTGKKKKS